MKFQVGQSAKIQVKVTDAMVRAFAELSGDKNPIHLDDAFAAQSRFKKRIAHGMITGALISRALATELPGPGAIYLSQSLKFTAPVFVDEEISINLTISGIREDKNILTLETIAQKLTGETVAKGEATVMVP
jgi:3-hydroxybutyryl-CoA dehydratase